jgi:hypothetical protein
VDQDAPETVTDEAEAQRGEHVAFEAEDVQHRAPGEDVVDVPVIDDDAAEAEFAEVGKGGAAREAYRVRKPQEAEVEAGERSHAEDGGGHVPIEQERPRAVDEEELLDALDGEVLQPERDLASELVHVTADEVGAADRPRVRGEDAGDGGGDRGRLVAFDVIRDLVFTVGEEVAVGEDERGGLPDGAPAAGEHGGARGVLDGEAPYDVDEECVREEAEAVDASAVGVEEDAEVAVDGDGRVGDRRVDVGEHAAHERLQLLWVHALHASHGHHLGMHGDWRCLDGRRRRKSGRGQGYEGFGSK